MPLHVLDDKLWFPPAHEALHDGLLAIGGDLSLERLLLAYRKGMFSWFVGSTGVWWTSDLRFVMCPE